MNCSASCYILDLAPQTSSPLARYVYTANDVPAQRDPEIEDDQIDPALLEDQRFTVAVEEKLSRLGKRHSLPTIGTTLSRVSELRMEEGGYTYKEAAKEEVGQKDARKTTERVGAVTLDDGAQNSHLEDNERLQVVTSSVNDNDSTSAANVGQSSSTRVADDQDDAAAFMFTLRVREGTRMEI
jgi:hypothetical protein